MKLLHLLFKLLHWNHFKIKTHNGKYRIKRIIRLKGFRTALIEEYITAIEIEVRMCCNSSDCGCMGLPIDPPICSNECYDKLLEQIQNKNSINDLQPFQTIQHKIDALEAIRQQQLKPINEAYYDRKSPHYFDNERFSWAIGIINKQFDEQANEIRNGNANTANDL